MGEDRTDDLQDRENALAEEYAAEDGGTGLNYYNDDAYDYDASSPLTDVDYQDGNNESSQFTDNYTGAEDYDPVNRDTVEDDDEYGVASFDDDDEYAAYSDDDDDEDEDDDEEEDEDDEEDDDEGDGENPGGQGQPSNRQNRQNNNSQQKNNHNNQNQKNKKQDLTNLHIDLQKFIVMWPIALKARRKDPSIGPLYTKVNRKILERIESLPGEGPATIKILKQYYSVKEAIGLPHGGFYGAFEFVVIDDMLEIITSMGKSILLTAVQTAKAIGDLNCTNVLASIFLKRTLETAIFSSEVYHDLNELYRKVIAALAEDDADDKKK